MIRKRVFGELEIAILRIFDYGDSLTVRDVLDRLNSDDYDCNESHGGKENPFAKT
jgi:hypothetical protein